MDYSHYMYLRKEVEEEARRARREDTRSYLATEDQPLQITSRL